MERRLDARLTHSRESHSDGSRLAHMLEHLGLAVTRDVMGHLEIAKCTCKEGRREDHHFNQQINSHCTSPMSL